MSVTAAVKGTITLTDNLTGSTSLSKVLSNAFTGSLSTYGQSVTVGTSDFPVTLPVSPVQFVYIRNLSSTTGTTVTVSWVPTGGTNTAIVTLDPQAVIIFCEVTTSFGITALHLVSNQAGTPVEFILAG